VPTVEKILPQPNTEIDSPNSPHRSRAPSLLQPNSFRSLLQCSTTCLLASLLISISSAQPVPQKYTPIYELVSESQIQGLTSLILGSIRQVRHGFDQAVSHYHHTLEHRQNIPLLYLDLIHYHATLNQFDQAEKILRSYPPQSPYHSIGQAIIAHHKNQPDQVIAKLTPYHHIPIPILHRLIILSHLQLLDEKSATEHIQKITHDFSPQWHAQAALLITPFILGETPYPSEPLTQALRALLKKACQSLQTPALLAAAEFEINIQNPLHALEILRNAAQINKRTDLSILLRLADLEYQHNSPQVALQYYLQAFKRNPDYPDLRQMLATIYTHLGQDDLALTHWQFINRQRPTQIQPIVEIALIHEKNKNELEAFKYWQQALMLQPENPRFHIAVILSKLTLQRHSEALQDAITFTKLFPTHPRAHYLEGIVQFYLRNYAAANLAFSQAEILASTADPQILDAHFFIQRATILEHLKQPQEAIQVLHRAHKKFPENVVIMNNLAYSWAEQNIELEKALALSLKTIEAEPQNASFLDTLGWIYYRLQRYPEALATLQKAIAIDPENPIILDHLAETYIQNNNIPQAIKLWKQALATHEQPEQIKKKIAQASLPATQSQPYNLAPFTQGNQTSPSTSLKQ
jgi:tetratricopeptide (TPR) repeat protein